MHKKIEHKIKESIKNHWYHIDMELKEEINWKGRWNSIDVWEDWDLSIHENVSIIKELKNILDITDEELQAILDEKE